MAVDMFLKMTGINGESLDKVHGKEIDVLAWSWGVSNSGTAHMGSGAGAGKANVQDLSVTKYIDAASPTLLQMATKGDHITESKLTVRKAGGTPLEYVIITMTDCLITSVSTGGSGGEDRLTENISINFGKVQLDYTTQAVGGGKGTTIPYKYNIVQNAPF